MMNAMLINDVGHFYRPRFTPSMTEQEYMGPYYGMGQEDPHVPSMSKTLLVLGAGAVFGFIVGYASRDILKNLLRI